ncbi:sulfatase [Tamlana fucoidanivorans]|uniref:Sulfatase n=1 Tax=Allotamlana fucoidanivorans TaxID=2583814 RepID=A0A5C4SNW4_9FLAO|nr:sulfatase [Tamlana fucoidanivorans]TNJ45859.1 sulfatase [Tamlana fucoidanivorans]
MNRLPDSFRFILISVFGSFFFNCSIAKKENDFNNVLFIIVDDLRPELNCYGQSQIISPNIDKLAADGMVFKNAYCNVPVCGASRASLLTGVFPTKNRFTNYGSRVDNDAPGLITLPEHFKNKGYITKAVGKIFHHPDDALQSWTDIPYRPDYPNSIKQQELWRDYQAPINSWTKENNLPLGSAGPAWEAADVEDAVYYDGKTAKLALAELNKLSQSKQPFFLGIGFIRPHLPFNAPKKYWDMYKEETIALAKNPQMPIKAPREAWFNYKELRGYSNIPKDTLPIESDIAKKLRHGYYASVSFIDAQVGKILDKLKELELYESTNIVLIGDHGWSLGEHSLWCKHSCFNNALRTPLIVKPKRSRFKNDTQASSESLVSFVDIYPSLCDLSNVEKPLHLSGKSFVEILTDPNHEINEYVFSRWGRGETVISKAFNYTRYFNKDGSVNSHMLYDRILDPDENVNVVDDKDHAESLNNLIRILQNHINKNRA